MIKEPETKQGSRIREMYEEVIALKQDSIEINKSLYMKESVDLICNIIHYIEGWKSPKKTPPNERVDVLFSDGRVGAAFPTYYPSTFEKRDGDERKPWGWRATPVFYSDGIERWDGGWLIEIGFSDLGKDREVAKWKRLKK